MKDREKKGGGGVYRVYVYVGGLVYEPHVPKCLYMKRKRHEAR